MLPQDDFPFAREFWDNAKIEAFCADRAARFITEHTQFPVSRRAHDDLLHAVSRAIDLALTRPMIVCREDTEPRFYWDR
jgi:hypothetical protein